MATRMRVSRRGVGQLLRSPMIEAEMLRRGQAIKAAAETLAPVGTPPEDPHPGLYKANVTVTSVRRGGAKRDRAVATVRNNAPYARWVEYGNGTPSGPAHHIMLRAAAYAGGG